MVKGRWIASVLALAAGCGSDTSGSASGSKCTDDTECPGQLVCDGGECVEPETASSSGTGGSTTSTSVGGAPSSSSSTGAASGVTVSGDIEIVNPGGATGTSVILTPVAGFVPNAARTEAPPGPKATGVSGHFSIPDVPDGDYVVLAAFENDLLVSDPDTGISGDGLLQLHVAGVDVTLSETLKVTGALEVVSPDDVQVAGTPTFIWRDDSGEDHYEIQIFEVQGALVWESTEIPGVSGRQNVSVDYAGPPLISGSLYQFRATSIALGGAAISRTEDLRGTFTYR